MMCYRDRTYCSAPCAAECSRKATQEVEEAAKRLELPLSLADLRDCCDEYVPTRSEWICPAGA